MLHPNVCVFLNGPANGTLEIVYAWHAHYWIMCVLSPRTHMRYTVLYGALCTCFFLSSASHSYDRSLSVCLQKSVSMCVSVCAARILVC